MEKKKKNAHKGEWKKFFKKLPWLLLMPIFYGLSLAAGKYPLITEEVYSTPLYPWISRGIGYVSSFAQGISLAECIVYCLAAIIAITLITSLYRLVMGRMRAAKFLSIIAGFAVAASVLFSMFYVTWGFNYSRPSLYTRMGLNIVERPVEELNAVCARLAIRASELREQLKEDENGVFCLEGTARQEFAKIPSAYKLLGEAEPLFGGRVYAAKGVMSSKAMSYGGISGIYIPFTAEANVNIDQPPLLLASSAAHETAHFLGIAREDEANFVSYLACSYSIDPGVRYSGTMLALIHCANQLYAGNKEMYANLVTRYYSEGMMRDIRHYNLYWDKFEGPVQETVNSVNDNYLKFNQQENGVKSYGMMVDLILAYYDKTGNIA